MRKKSILFVGLLFAFIVSSTIGDDNFDCLMKDKANCEKVGCVWNKNKDPNCHYSDSSFGYTILSKNNTALGRRYSLNLSVPINATFPFPPAFDKPTIDVEFQTDTRLRVKIYDKGVDRYEVPVSKMFPKVNKKAVNVKYNFTYIDDSHFQVTAKRQNREVVIWDTSVGAFILSDQLLQLSTKLPSTHLYGFGEKVRDTFKQDFSKRQKIGMFSRDQFPYPNSNLYGVHPFYMVVEEGGDAHGVLLLNSNAMEAELQEMPALTYRTIGGILDFYFFFGPTPENVVQQYTELIGRPVLPSYWSLGFQLCRWGYNSLAEVRNTTDRMKEYDIPQDVQYGDIDYMHRQLDFVIKEKEYKGLPEYVREIKKEGIKYITILDPAISNEEKKGTYETLDLGNELGIWIKNGTTDQPIIGKVWPDKENVTKNSSWTWNDQVKYLRAEVVFPDFFHENITMWWNKLIKKFHKTLEFDGLWIDMNEVANFVEGSINGCPKENKFETPPYKPNIIESLQSKTLCMSAKHQDGEIEYNYHSLFGWKQSEITRQALTETINKRGIVISRSTFPSSGQYIGHWLGDNKSKWPDLHWSIIGMMDMSLFGIPYSGADICGFFGDAEYRLCLRWMQLGAFYPFSRNHNGNGNKRQDPASYDEKFANMSRSILHVRYTLLPYLYTLFYYAHTSGNTVVRPVFHEFSKDENTLTIDRQFMWGPALLITPILKENATTVKGYLPKARWFDYYTDTEMDSVKNGKNHTFQVPIDQIGLHLRGGYIIPTQEPANNTMFSRRNPMGLIVILNEEYKAEGSLFWDDGDSLDSVSRSHILLKFKASMDLLTISVVVNEYTPDEELFFNKIAIYGMKNISYNPIKHLKIDNEASKSVKATFVGDVLKIENLNLPIKKPHTITWIHQTENSGVTNSQTTLFMLFNFMIAYILGIYIL